MNILAFGVTGFVGSHLLPLLHDNGHQVTVAARSAAPRLPVAVPVIQADPTVPGPWQDRVATFDAIINLAGTPVTTRWTDSGRKAILQSRTHSTRNIVQAMRPGGGQTLLCANAVGYYGDGKDTILTEESPSGSGFLPEVARAWQNEALRATAHGHRVIMPRIAVVLGHGGALAKMLPAFRMGLGGCLGSGRQWFPWIHVHDLVRSMAFTLGRPDFHGPYNACAPNLVTNREFTRTLAGVLHRPAVLPVPACMLRLIMGQAASMLLEGQRCVPSALEQSGFTFAFSALGPALEDIIRPATRM